MVTDVPLYLLQADIFPDKEHGGRVFYNEAILNSMGIPQVRYVYLLCLMYL